MPGRLRCVSSSKHCVPAARIVIPATVRFQVHGAKLPCSHGIVNAFEKPPVLLLLADFEPVLDENNAVVLDESLEPWDHADKVFVLLIRAKTHHMFYQGTVIPTAVKEDHLSRGRHMDHIALRIHL